MSIRTGQAALFRVADADPAGNRCEGLVCGTVGVVTDPSVVTGVVLAGLAALVAFAYVRDASETCRRERRRVLDERDAFVEFAQRVEALNPVAPESAAATAAKPPTVDHHSTRPASAGDVTLRRLLSIYEGTVMSVSHYEEEYDETVSESLGAELGPDLATSLSANRALSPSAQHAIVRRSREVAAVRASLAEAIETELDALSDVETELTTIDQRRRHLMEHLAEVGTNKTDAAIDVWHQLNDLETEVESVATERQRDLRDPPMRPNSGSTDTGEMAFYDYLYGGTDGPRHPVLSQIAEVTATIRTDLDHIGSRIADGG